MGKHGTCKVFVASGAVGGDCSDAVDRANQQGSARVHNRRALVGRGDVLAVHGHRVHFNHPVSGGLEGHPRNVAGVVPAERRG